jgi:CRISPR-associated exonuclease Cas4
MYTEDDLLPISALSQLLYCERRCALIHIEQVWDENRYTVEGKLLHERVHEQEGESRGDVRIARGLALRSLRLGLTGKADVVEFHRIPQDAPIFSDPNNRQPKTENRLWRPFPVEYKRGRPKPDDSDRVQLCAQALCLEEMLNTDVPAGALFYGATRHRLDVTLDHDLRQTTEAAAQRLHELIASGTTPKAVAQPKCEKCSLNSLCMPGSTGGRSAARYIERMLRDMGDPAT